MTEIEGFLYPGGFVPYEGDLMVIYGENGAGKSLLLESVLSSLTGSRVGRTPRNDTEFFGNIESAVLARVDVTELRDIHESGTYSFDVFGDAVRRGEESVSGLDMPEALRAAWGRLLDEVVSRRRTLLVHGDDSGPGWRAYAASGHDSAAVGDWRRAVHAYVRERFETEDLYEALDAWFDEGDLEFELRLWMSSSQGDLESEGVFRFVAQHFPVQHGGFGRVVTEESAAPEALVRRWLSYTDWSPDDWDGAGEVIGAMRAEAAAWTERANRLLATFLLDPPDLVLEVGGRRDWVFGTAPAWGAGPGRDVNSLSHAERRWVRLAIALSEPFYFGVKEVPFLVLDEPESGLHRAGERHMAEGLLRLVEDGVARPIIATHSPDLLDAGRGQVAHLQKHSKGGIGALRMVDAQGIDDLKSVGLTPSSLLNRERGFLLVEGEHDKQLFEGWFERDLRSMRVGVLPMRGTRNLMTLFDSSVLVEMTDAVLMPVLDDVAIDPLIDVWVAAEAAMEERGINAAVGVIKNRIKEIPGAAAREYEPFLTDAITRGQAERLLPLGMAKKDVLEYVPVKEVIPSANSWGELRREWAESPASMGKRTGKDYKDWLRRSKGADLSPEALRLIAETTAPPVELKGLIARVSERLEQAKR